MFLTGSANTLLTIPLLTSLLPKAARAQASQRPLRFIMFTNQHSPNAGTFFGKFDNTAKALNLATGPGNLLLPSVPYAPLTSVSGDISYILGPLSNFKSKMAVLRGLDCMSLENGPHPDGMPSTGSGHGSNKKYNRMGQMSVDAVIAKKLFPSMPQSRRLAVLYPEYKGDVGSGGGWNQRSRSSTWDANPGFSGADETRTIATPSTTYTKTVLERFFGSLPSTPTSGGSTSTPTDSIPRRDLLNLVFQDYKQVVTSPNLGSEDKRKLEAYMSLLSDIQNAEQAPMPVGSCTMPSLENDYPPPANASSWASSQKDAANPALYRNHVKLVVAAFACDLLRVAAIGFEGSGSHTFHHSAGMQTKNETSNAEAAAFFGAHRNMANRVAQMMTALEAFNEGGSSLLDNTLIYWNQQYGCVYTSGGGHSLRNFPVFLGGGAGGKLRMGNYYDYRFQVGTEDRGLPLSNLLVTIMGIYGVGPSDYEYKADQGYGAYDGSFGQALPGNLKTITAKRTPLPYLLK